MPLTLNILPVEMLDAIVSHLAEKRDLCNLSLACRALHLPSVRQLFHASQVTFKMTEHCTMDCTEAEQFVEAISTGVRPALLYTGVDTASTYGSFVRTLYLNVDMKAEGSAYGTNGEPALFRSSAHHAARFLRFLAVFAGACPNLRTLDLYDCGFDRDLLGTVSATVDRVQAAAAGLNSLQVFANGWSVSHADIWYEMLLPAIWSKLLKLDIQLVKGVQNYRAMWERIASSSPSNRRRNGRYDSH